MVGATGAGINFLSLAVLLEVFVIDYRVGVTVSYLLGVIFHFLTNKLLTFKNREFSNVPSQLFRYVTVAAISYVVTILIVVIVVEGLHSQPYFGVIASLAVTVVIHYMLSKHWIFAYPRRGN